MNNLYKQVLENIKKEKFLSVTNILVMSVTFLCLGFFIVIISLTQTAMRYLEQQAQITVFFKDDYTEESILKIKAQYETDPRIYRIKYVSKEEAFKIFTELNKDEPVLVESITASILPASLEVSAKNIANLAVLTEEFSKVNGVEDVRFFKDVIDQFKFWSGVFYIGGFVMLTVFFLISYAIILSTLKATINSKGVELSIMKLVGASDNYIKRPFVFQGMLFGLVSSSVAGLIIVILGIVSYNLKILGAGISLGYMHGVYFNPIVFSLQVFFILIIFGGLLGYLGSYAAVKKYLKY